MVGWPSLRRVNGRVALLERGVMAGWPSLRGVNGIVGNSMK